MNDFSPKNNLSVHEVEERSELSVREYSGNPRDKKRDKIKNIRF
jgi:hypothetical protein